MLKRIKYWTMNSWNRSESLAYNMKVYNLFNGKALDKAFDILNNESHPLFDDIRALCWNFESKYNHKYQAGFNGRSGGYLVLYTGGINENGSVYCRTGVGLNEREVPSEVKRDFRTLALNIYKVALGYVK